MISKKKLTYLRLNEKKNVANSKAMVFKNEFFNLMYNNELSIKPFAFYSLSIISATFFFLINMIILKNIYIAGATMICGLFVPYLWIKAPMILGYRIDNTNAYKEFISILQSALRSTNSTTEALKIAAKETVNNYEIDVIMHDIFQNLQLGDNIMEALTKAENKTKNKHMRMALTIIRINHEVGTAKSIKALENINKDLDYTIENIKLLKDSINGVVIQKMFFFLGVMFVPIFLCSIGNHLGLLYFEIPFNSIVYSILIFVSLILQFIADRDAEKASHLV